MHRKATAVLATLITLAACADGSDPLAPESSRYAITQSGNGAAYHGYQAPALELQLGGTQLCAQWGDPAELSAQLTGIGRPAADHFSYEFELEDGEAWTELGDASAASATSWACIDVAALELPARIRVVGMAKSGTGRATTTHHSLPAYQVLGGGYTISAVGGNCRTGTAPNVNAATWNLSFQLYFGGVLVADGSDVYVNGVLATYDVDKNEYHHNNAGGGTGSVDWGFRVASIDGPDAGSFICSAPLQVTGKKR